VSCSTRASRDDDYHSSPRTQTTPGGYACWGPTPGTRAPTPLLDRRRADWQGRASAALLDAVRSADGEAVGLLSRDVVGGADTRPTRTFYERAGTLQRRGSRVYAPDDDLDLPQDLVHGVLQERLRNQSLASLEALVARFGPSTSRTSHACARRGEFRVPHLARDGRSHQVSRRPDLAQYVPDLLELEVHDAWRIRSRRTRTPPSPTSRILSDRRCSSSRRCAPRIAASAPAPKVGDPEKIPLSSSSPRSATSRSTPRSDVIMSGGIRCSSRIVASTSLPAPAIDSPPRDRPIGAGSRATAERSRRAVRHPQAVPPALHQHALQPPDELHVGRGPALVCSPMRCPARCQTVLLRAERRRSVMKLLMQKLLAARCARTTSICATSRGAEHFRTTWRRGSRSSRRCGADVRLAVPHFVIDRRAARQIRCSGVRRVCHG